MIDDTTQETLFTIGRYFSSTSKAVSYGELYDTCPSTDPILTINATALNNILANITISAIPFYKRWYTKVDQNRTTTVNVYTLSRPLNLILPYTTMLVSALGVLLLGAWALNRNGVVAADGGFLQVLTTTRGCEEVDRVARSCCLGSEDNWSSELKKLKVRFGELDSPSWAEMDIGGRLHGRETEEPKLAGFGIDGKVKYLSKDEVYGGHI
jgi:hypothetical protein